MSVGQLRMDCIALSPANTIRRNATTKQSKARQSRKMCAALLFWFLFFFVGRLALSMLNDIPFGDMPNPLLLCHTKSIGNYVYTKQTKCHRFISCAQFLLLLLFRSQFTVIVSIFILFIFKQFKKAR